MIKNIAFYIVIFVLTSFVNAGISGSIKLREIKGERIKIDFSNQFFENRDFKGSDCQNADFRNSVFEKVDFTGANLTGSRFEGAIFKDVKFTEACLNRAYFNNCEFSKVDFRSANLSEAYLINSFFKESNFLHANVEGTVIYYPLDDPNSSGALMIEQIYKVKGILTPQLLYEYSNFLEDLIRDLIKKVSLKSEGYQILDQQANGLYTLKNCLESSSRECSSERSISSRCRMPSWD